jgi:hypothetical protein
LPPTYNEAVLKNLSVIGTAKNEDVEQSHLWKKMLLYKVNTHLWKCCYTKSTHLWKCCYKKSSCALSSILAHKIAWTYYMNEKLDKHQEMWYFRV